MPKVLNKHRHGTPAGSVYIGRGSPYGNPFKIGEHGNRDDVSALRGKDLVCFCAPARRHGDALLRKANS